VRPPDDISLQIVELIWKRAKRFRAEQSVLRFWFEACFHYILVRGSRGRNVILSVWLKCWSLGLNRCIYRRLSMPFYLLEHLLKAQRNMIRCLP